jgi:hypothetical protein
MLDTNKHDKDREVQQLGEWGEKTGYKLGFLAGATSFGLLAGLILGVIAIAKYSHNELIKKSTQAVSNRAQHNQISLKDLDQLSAGQPITNQECIHTAMFIDGLERKLGALSNGYQVGDNYTFTKTIDPTGVINYKVEDRQTNQIALSFDLDREGKISVQSRNNFEAMGKLNEFVILNADKASVNINDNISLYSDQASQAGIVEQEVKSVTTSIGLLNRVDLTRLATGAESAQSQYMENLDELNHQLTALKSRAQVICDQIHTAEVANNKESQRHPEQTFLGIKVACLINKLVGLEKQIDSLQTDLQDKPQTLEELQAYRTETTIPSTVPGHQVNTLNHQIRALQAQVKGLTPAPSASRQQSAKSVSPKASHQAEHLSEHGSFSTAEEYPDLPADLQDLASESYGNGQPITLIEPESSDDEAQGMAQ